MLDSLSLSPSLRASLQEATDRYHQNVHEARSYLEGRGVAESVVAGSLLGVVCDPAPGHERFKGWLSLPYVTAAGVVAIKFRNLDPESDRRYDAPAGSKVRLYNARSLANGGDVAMVVEGEFKQLVAASFLPDIPIVATWGTNWFDHWSRCFGDFDRVIVVGDNDDRRDKDGNVTNPGRKHAEKVVKAISGAELVLPPLGVQLDEWLLQEGAESVRERCGI